MLDPALGASALLDMGIYPLTLAHLMLGEAESIVATGVAVRRRHRPRTSPMAGRYPGGALATMSASMTSWSSRRAEIATDRGRIVLEDFHHPDVATFHPFAGGSDDGTDAGAPLRIHGEVPVIGRGFGHEIAEVGRCIDGGLQESPFVTARADPDDHAADGRRAPPGRGDASRLPS